MNSMSLWMRCICWQSLTTPLHFKVSLTWRGKIHFALKSIAFTHNVLNVFVITVCLTPKGHTWCGGWVRCGNIVIHNHKCIGPNPQCMAASLFWIPVTFHALHRQVRSNRLFYHLFKDEERETKSHTAYLFMFCASSGHKHHYTVAHMPEVMTNNVVNCE